MKFRVAKCPAAGAFVVTALSPGSLPIPPHVMDWSKGQCSCHMDPFETKIPTCLVPCISGIELQLLCIVMIKWAQKVEIFVLFPGFTWKGALLSMPKAKS